MLSAVGCILYLCWYNPLLYILAVTLTPLPLTLLAYRQGWRYGLAGLAITSLGVMACLGPPDAMLYVGLFGVMGFITGFLLHRGLSPERILAEGSVLVTAYDVFGYYCLERLFGLEDSMAPVRKVAMAALAAGAANVPPELAQSAQAFQRAGEDFFSFPLALFFGGAAAVFVANYVISLVALRQLGIRLQVPKGIHLFRLPVPAGVACLLLFLAAPAAVESGSKFTRIAYVNLVLLAMVFLFAEAWSVVLCLLDLTEMRPPARFAALIAFLALFPFTLILGLADSLFDLRAIAVQFLN
ncbi:MAG: DUF2232 domain-containing protein [Candidatus Wallbacteria bacterium]|nr:DUF2232 domain-containing protein [Candidatus Wallbacteria bacterium]